MKKIILNSRKEAINKGFLANWEFVHDKVMSPEGIDFTPLETNEWRARKPLPPSKEDMKIPSVREKYHEEVRKHYQFRPMEKTVMEDGKVVIYQGLTKDFTL